MEYNYDTVLSNVFEKYKLEIIQLFQKYFDENRTFEYSIDEIRKNLVSERCDTIIYKNESIFSNCVYLFNHFEATFKKGSSISKIIETDILTSFNKINIDANHELYNYSFEEFVDDLIVYDTLGRIEKRLFLNKELYQLFFELNNYEEFTLEPFEGEVTNSELYKKYYKILHPEINVLDNVEVLPIKEISTPSKSKEIDTLKFNISKFSENEKLFLLHICLNRSNNIPLSESAKIIVIASNINNLSIFLKKTNNCTFYDKLNKGIDQYTGKPQKEFIDNIIIKLEPFGLININRIVHSIKSKIK